MWERPEDLLDRTDVEKMVQGPPDQPGKKKHVLSEAAEDEPFAKKHK